MHGKQHHFTMLFEEVNSFRLSIICAIISRKNSSFHLGNANITELLLQYGAKVNALDASQKTPLHWAAYNCNFLLIYHNLELNLTE